MKYPFACGPLEAKTLIALCALGPSSVTSIRRWLASRTKITNQPFTFHAALRRMWLKGWVTRQTLIAADITGKERPAVWWKITLLGCAKADQFCRDCQDVLDLNRLVPVEASLLTRTRDVLELNRSARDPEDPCRPRWDSMASL